MSVLLEQLNRDLVADAQMLSHVSSVRGNSANQLAQRKVADWLVAWIQKGNFDSRSTAVTEYLRNNFQVKQGIKVESTPLMEAIQGIVTSKTATIKANLETLNGSTSVLLAGRQPYELQLVKDALGQISGKREAIAESDKKAANGEMALRFSELVNQAIGDSGIHIDINGSRSEQAAQLQQLQESITTKLKENEHLFTADFMTHVKTQVTELKHDTEAFYAPLINSNEENHLLDALVGKLTSGNINWTVKLGDESIDLSKLSDQELAERIGAEQIADAAKTLEAKLKSYAQHDGPDVITAMQEEITGGNSFSPAEKALLLMKARDADAIRSVQRENSSSLGELFNKVNFSSLLSVATIGCLGGMIFGSPIMGIMITGLLSFLGNVDKPKPAPPAPAQ